MPFMIRRFTCFILTTNFKILLHVNQGFGSSKDSRKHIVEVGKNVDTPFNHMGIPSLRLQDIIWKSSPQNRLAMQSHGMLPCDHNSCLARGTVKIGQ